MSPFFLFGELLFEINQLRELVEILGVVSLKGGERGGGPLVVTRHAPGASGDLDCLYVVVDGIALCGTSKFPVVSRA